MPTHDDLLPLDMLPSMEDDEILAAIPGASDYKVDFLMESTSNGQTKTVPLAGHGMDDPELTAEKYDKSNEDDSPIPAAINGISLSALADATNRVEAAATQAAAAPVRMRKVAPVDDLTIDDLLDTGAGAAEKPAKSTTHGSSSLDVSEYSAQSNEELPSIIDTHLDELLHECQALGGSDLHVTAGLPPMVRKDGKIIALSFQPLTDRDTQRLVYDILTSEQLEKFELTKELDFSYGVKGLGRYRFNVFRQRGSVGAAMRVIPQSVPSLDELRLPPVLRDLVRRHAGLILVTGPTGSGKSTTIASMIDLINRERQCHIMTIEDPIEYLHRHKVAMVNQRELGTDTDSFHNALRAVLREDPDVILIGEMRDLETIAAAITLSETGHLVFATLHTRSAAATMDRIVDVFPAHQQQQIRIQLATSLEAVVSQQLLPRMGGGRVAAIEILVATSAIRNLIREGKTHQIMSVIETGTQFGMQAMDRVLADLHRQGSISYEEAVTHSIDRENFQHLLRGH